MEEKEPCPVCKKRAVDFLEWNGKTVIRLKCPHCGNLVVIKKKANMTG